MRFQVAQVAKGGLLSAFRNQKYSFCVIAPAPTWKRMIIIHQ
jgi:hypothetical protein